MRPHRGRLRPCKYRRIRRRSICRLFSTVLIGARLESSGSYTSVHVIRICQTWYLSRISRIRGEKIVMWRNFSFSCMTIVGKFQFNWWGFIAIYAVLLLNLLFTLFCRKIFATIYGLSCGEKLSQKVHLRRKNDKYEVCEETTWYSSDRTAHFKPFNWGSHSLLLHYLSYQI